MRLSSVCAFVSTLVLTYLSGETGSGKSIVVDALGLLLGGRASADMLRTGAEKARISGIFEAPKPASDLLADAGIDMEGEETDHRPRNSQRREVTGLDIKPTCNCRASSGSGSIPRGYPWPA